MVHITCMQHITGTILLGVNEEEIQAAEKVVGLYKQATPSINKEAPWESRRNRLTRVVRD